MSSSISKSKDRPRVLIVDDEGSFRRLLVNLLGRHHEIAVAATGETALAIATQFSPDLVLLDIQMPGMTGYETCRRLRAIEGKRPQVVIVSGATSWDAQVRAFTAGADDYVVKPIQLEEFLPRVQLHLALRHVTASAEAVRTQIGHYQSELTRRAADEAVAVTDIQDITVTTLAAVVESRDKGTGQHLRRMQAYSKVLAEELRAIGSYSRFIDSGFVGDLSRSSPLHDIGKVGIPDSILFKPGRLTNPEFETVKLHTVIGANLLDRAVLWSKSGSFLAMAAVIVRYHHERWDGTGYPIGLVANEIPLPARIVAVAEVFDALTSDRPYRKAMTPAEATAIIEQESGTHFDPSVVRAFLRSSGQFNVLYEKFGDPNPLVLGASAAANPDLAFPFTIPGCCEC